MLEQRTIGHPEVFQFDQEQDVPWYSDTADSTTRKLTVMALLLHYLANTRPELQGLTPQPLSSVEQLTQFSTKLGGHLSSTPTVLSTLHFLSKGLVDYAQTENLSVYPRSLDIPWMKKARPSFDQCVAFLHSRLLADCPVALLFFPKGKLPFRLSRQWAIVVELHEEAGGKILCTLLENGTLRTIDLRLWYQTSCGGAFFCLSAGDE